MLKQETSTTPVKLQNISVSASNSGTSNESLQELTAQLQVVPSVNQIVEEMIQKAEMSQASQSSLVPDSDFKEQGEANGTTGIAELDSLMQSVKSTAKKPLPFQTSKETGPGHAFEGNTIINQTVRIFIPS